MAQWVDAAPVKDFLEGEYKALGINGLQAVVYYYEGHFFALEDVCTHDGGQLSGGRFTHGEAICPRHGARFCIRTGEVKAPPAYEPATTLPVRVHEGMVQIEDPYG